MRKSSFFRAKDAFQILSVVDIRRTLRFDYYILRQECSVGCLIQGRAAFGYQISFRLVFHVVPRGCSQGTS